MSWVSYSPVSTKSQAEALVPRGRTRQKWRCRFSYCSRMTSAWRRETALFRTKDEGDAGRHTCAKVVAGLTQDNDHAAGHIFAAMGPDTLDNGKGTTITHGKAFARPPGSEELPAGRAVENGIADDSVVLRREVRVRWRSDDNLSTSHTLTDVIIGLTTEDKAHTGHAEGTKALTSRTLEGTGDAHARQPLVPVAARYLTRETGTNGAVVVANTVLRDDAAFSGQRLLRLDQQAI